SRARSRRRAASATISSMPTPRYSSAARACRTASASAISRRTGAAATWNSTSCGIAERCSDCNRTGVPKRSCCRCRRWRAGATSGRPKPAPRKPRCMPIFCRSGTGSHEFRMTDSPDDPRPARGGEDDALAEKRISGEQVYAGALLDVRRDRARLPDGGEAVREYIVHRGAVLIVPVKDDGRFVIERQFRYPHNRTFLEFPAGKLDPGESALATGMRELIEESGYTASVWTRLGIIHPVISYSTEAIELYAARGLAHVGAKLDHGEFLEIVECTEAELYAAIDEARVTDAKTIAALLM